MIKTRNLALLLVTFLCINGYAQTEADREKHMREHQAKVEAVRKKLLAQNPKLDVGQAMITAEEMVQREEDMKRQAEDNKRRINDEKIRNTEMAQQKENERLGKQDVPVPPINPETGIQNKELPSADNKQPMNNPSQKPNVTGTRKVESTPAEMKAQVANKVRVVEQKASQATSKQQEARAKIDAASTRLEAQYKMGQITKAAYEEKRNRIQLAKDRVSQSEEHAKAAKAKMEAAKKRVN